MVANAELRKHYRQRLAQESDFSCERSWHSVQALLHGLSTSPAPELILMELAWDSPPLSEVFTAIRRQAPESRIVVLADTATDPAIAAALLAGATGCLVKHSPDSKVVEGLREVRSGGACMSPSVVKTLVDLLRQTAGAQKDYRLTKRERLHLQMMTRGLSKKEIASELSLSFHTVDSHLRSIYRKLEVNTRSGAVAKALRHRLC
jgi:DNA-binding NarL/FixJ family response regulator